MEQKKEYTRLLMHECIHDNARTLNTSSLPAKAYESFTILGFKATRYFYDTMLDNNN